MCADITCSYFEFKAHVFKTVDAPREKIAADDRHRVSFRVRPGVNGPIQAGMSCPFAAVKNRDHKLFSTTLMTQIRAFCESVAAFSNPQTNLLLNRKRLRGIQCKLRFQSERMAFQRNGKMRVSSKKTSDEEIRILFQTENLKLHRMHQTVEQGAFDDKVVEYDHVDKRY